MPLGEPKLSSPWTLAQYANFTYLPQASQLDSEPG